MSARLAEDPVFGEVALLLAARARPDPRRRLAGREWLQVEFAPRGLSTAERELVSALGSQRAEPAGDESRRRVIACAREALADLASRSAGAEALLAAHDNSRLEPRAARLMGVVNVTPDSFSDRGQFLDPERAIEHGLRLAAEGASVIDVGGESSRPGAEPVDADTELARVIPVVSGLARRSSIPISIDTTKAAVAEAALESGASIVNDISAGRFDPRMLETVASHGAGFIAMHMQGTPRDMQAHPAYEDVLTEVTEFLRQRARACLEAGIDRAKLWIDPGIGFGKSLEHNLDLLALSNELGSLGLPVCLGVSRKSFIATIDARARRALPMETRAPLALPMETRAPLALSGETRAPLALSGETKAPFALSSEARARPVLSGDAGMSRTIADDLRASLAFSGEEDPELALATGAKESSAADDGERAPSSDAGSDPDDRLDRDDRVGGTAAAIAIGVWHGAELLRVHDVRVMAQALRVAEALSKRNRREARD
jgi:dihydropteroate synthase